MSEKQEEAYSHVFQVKEKDLNEKDHTIHDQEIYPDSTEDMTCWQKFKNSLNNFINRTIDYFEYDRVFNGENQPTVDLRRCYKRFLENYDETYSEREMRFAYSFEYVLHEKLKEEEKKEKNFWNQFYRFICCQGGNEMEELDEAYRSEREYQKIAKRKLLERKQEFEEMMRKEEEKQKQRLKEEERIKNQQKLQEIINNDSLEFNQDIHQTQSVVKSKKTTEVQPINTKVLKINQTEQHIVSSQLIEEHSSHTRKKGDLNSNAFNQQHTNTNPIESPGKTNIFYHQDIEESPKTNKHAKSFNQASDPQFTKNKSSNQLTNTSSNQNIITENIYHQSHIYKNTYHQEDGVKRKKRNKAVEDLDDFQERDERKKNDDLQGRPLNNVSKQKNVTQDRQEEGDNDIHNTRKNLNDVKNSSNPQQEQLYGIKTRINQRVSQQNYSNETSQPMENSLEQAQPAANNPDYQKNSKQNNQLYESGARHFSPTHLSAHPQDQQINSDSNKLSGDRNSSSINDPPLAQAQSHSQYGSKNRNKEHIEETEHHSSNAQKRRNNRNVDNVLNQQDTSNLNSNQQARKQPLSPKKAQNNNFDFDYEMQTSNHQQRPNQQHQPTINQQRQPSPNNDPSKKAKKTLPSKNLRTNQQEGELQIPFQSPNQRQSMPFKSPKINNDNTQIYFEQNDLQQEQNRLQNQQVMAQAKKRRNKQNPSNQQQELNQIDLGNIDQGYVQDGPSPKKQVEKSEEVPDQRSKKQKRVKNVRKSEEEALEVDMQEQGVNQNQQREEGQMPVEQSRKKKKVKKMMQQSQQQDEIMLDDFATFNNNTEQVNTLPASGQTEPLQASKKRRNKKQLRPKDDDLNVDEVVFDALADEPQIEQSNIQEEEVNVKAEKKKRKVKARREEEGHEEEVIQINF